MLFLRLPFLGSQLDASGVQQRFSTLLGQNSNISHPWRLLGYSLSSQPTHVLMLIFFQAWWSLALLMHSFSIWQKTRGTPIYRLLGPFLCTARSSAIHCPEKSSHLGRPELQSLFPSFPEDSMNLLLSVGAPLPSAAI